MIALTLTVKSPVYLNGEAAEGKNCQEMAKVDSGILNIETLFATVVHLSQHWGYTTVIFRQINTVCMK